MKKTDKYLYEFSAAETNWIRGLTPIGIVAIHTIEEVYTGSNQMIQLFSKGGFLCVSIFFLLSGYGLISSVQKKEKYLDGFLLSRGINILVPVYVTEIFYLIAKALSTGFNLYDTAHFLNFLRYVSYSWYVLAIGVIYILFDLAYSLCKEWGFQMFVISLGFTYLMCLVFNVDIVFYKCMPALIIGMCYAKWYSVVRTIMCKNFPLLIIIGGLSLFFLANLNKYMNSLLTGGFISGIFAFGICLMSAQFTIKNRITDYLATISYELYLIHGLVIQMLKLVFNNPSLTVSFMVVFLISLPVATLLHFINRKIKNKLVQLLDINLKQRKLLRS